MHKTRSPLSSILRRIIKGSKKKKRYSRPASDDFESLTGKELPTWQYVKTKDDFEHLKFYKALYDSQKAYLTEPAVAFRVPQILHFIWIGGRPFPRESVENVRTWIAKHPNWTVKFWTDRERPVPVPGMEFNNICNLDMPKLGACFEKSDNYGEKSDLLRLEILYRDGGIYVDHDVKCFQAFDPLNTAYDFYCGIDMPYRSSLPSCVYTTNNLIGVKPRHPIILRSMELIEQQWEALQKAYPGDDRDSMLNRVLHRTFWLFGEAVKQSSCQDGNRDIVFPAYYFDAPHDDLALWARHQYAGVWHETETPFEKMVRQRLIYLSKKSNKMLLLAAVMFGLNLIGFCLLIWLIGKTLAAR